MSKYRKIIPLGTFLLYFLKISLQPATLVEAAILLILGSIAAFYEFKSNDKIILELQEKMNLLLKQHEELKETHSKDMDSMKSHVAGIKLSTSFKGQGLR